MKKLFIFLICLLLIILNSCTEEPVIQDIIEHKENINYNINETFIYDYYPSRINIDTLYKDILPSGYYTKYKYKSNLKILSDCTVYNYEIDQYSIDLFDPYFSTLSQAYPDWHLESAIYHEYIANNTEVNLTSKTTFDKHGRVSEYILNITVSHFIKVKFSYDRADNLTGMKVYDETRSLIGHMKAVFKDSVLNKYNFYNKNISVNWYKDKDGTCHLREISNNFPDITFDFVLQKTPEEVVITKYEYHSGYYFARCYKYDNDGNFLYGEKWSSIDDIRTECYNEYDPWIY